MGLFKKKKKSGRQGAASAPGSDDFWGSPESTTTIHIPESDSRSDLPDPHQEKGKKKTLLELLEPMFLYVCRLHRIQAAQGDLGYKEVRSKIEHLLKDLDKQANADPMLRQHFDHLEEPLKWFLDCMFGTADSSFPNEFWEQWSKDYMGEEVKSDDGKLTGGNLFFDDRQRGLDAALDTDPRDPISNERLAFYYVCIGIGLQGQYYEEPEKLREYMQKIYPRISHLVDLEPEAPLTPDAYGSVDTRNFVAIVRDRPLILFAAFMAFMLTIALAYVVFYTELDDNLQDALTNIRNRSIR